jgi:D-glycero-alpha-D-manno-heptose-7-phosphate kinase
MNFISKTPLRVSLFGGGSDFKEYYNEYGGAVLGGTIDKYIITTCLGLPKFSQKKYKLSYRTTEEVVSHSEFSHPVVRAVLAEMDWKRPLNLSTMSELPGGTGLGSSSAFTVGLINLLNRARGVILSPIEIANQAYKIEHDILGERGGFQDQLHASIGGLNFYEFSDDGVKIKPMNLRNDLFELLNEEVMLVFTGAQRFSSHITESYLQRLNSNSNNSQIKEMVALAHYAKNILLSEKSSSYILNEIALLLNESWKLKKNLSSEISNQHINDMYEHGLKSGARAGKLCGAGSCGFMLFIVPKCFQGAFIDQFGSNFIIKFKFTDHGTQITSL